MNVDQIVENLKSEKEDHTPAADTYRAMQKVLADLTEMARTASTVGIDAATLSATTSIALAASSCHQALMLARLVELREDARDRAIKRAEIEEIQEAVRIDLLRETRDMQRVALEAQGVTRVEPDPGEAN